MNLEQLQYIIEVSKSGSLTLAAQKSHITLSAISQSISMLENELGVSLFTRSRGQSAIPTREGKVIIAKATEILMKVNELKEEANDFKNTLSGELRIATIPGPTHLLVNTVSRFKQDFPNVKIEIFERGPNEIIENLQSHKIDIGLIVSEEIIPKNSGLLYERLLEGKMVVGVSSSSPLSSLKSLSPEKLQQETLILYDDPIIKNFVEEYISIFGKTNILFTTNNTLAIENAVVSGLGITIGLDFSFLKNKGLVPIEIKLPNYLPIHYVWVRHDGKFSSQIAKTFLNRLSLEI